MNIHLTAIDVAIFAGYMLAVLALGVFASREGQRTKRDYFLAGDRLPWWMIGASIVAANISSHHFVGIMGTAYAKGFVSMHICWGSVLVGFNSLLWIFLPFYLRNGFYTMPEFLARRFGGAARGMFAVLVVLTYIFVEISSVLYLGALVIHELLGIPVMLSVVVLAVGTGLYTITGGLRAVVWTEMFQLSVLLMGGVALLVATLRATGGVSALAASSRDWHLLLPASDADFPWTMYLGGILCISTFYCATNQFIVQRALAARDESHARRGIVLAQYLTFLMPLIIIVPGLAAPKLFPALERPDLVFPKLVTALLPTGLVGLVMAGLVAAVMSHISGAVNSCTTIATIDFYLPLKRRIARRTSLAAEPDCEADEERGDAAGRAVRSSGRPGHHPARHLLGEHPECALGQADLHLPAQRLRLFHAGHRHHVSAGHSVAPHDPAGRYGGRPAQYPAFPVAGNLASRHAVHEPYWRRLLDMHGRVRGREPVDQAETLVRA